MAIYRYVSMNFWTDSKVVDEFSPEDKYFYLYCFTNPHTNLCGCYEISPKQIANEMGYAVDSILVLLDRFETVYNVLRYSSDTKELLLLNWHKYNWTTSEKFRKPLLKEIDSVKETSFKLYLSQLANGGNADTVSIPYQYGSDTTVTVTVNNNISVNDSNTVNNNYSSLRNEIIDYLNECTGKNFRSNASSTVRLLDARIKEGYTVEEFKKVIDNKVYEWKGTDQEQYLRPETLFAPSHFESYLNQQKTRKKKQQSKGNGRDWDKL